MPLPVIFRTSVFRLTILYVVLFGISAAGLGAFIYLTTVGYLQRQTDEVIQSEIEVLREEFERGQDPLRPSVALNRLREMINNRDATRQYSDEWFYYMLVDRNTRKVAGNLDRWPEAEVNDGWIEFDVEATDGQMVPVRARILPLIVEVTALTGPLPPTRSVEETGDRLLVGREIRELSAINQRFIRALTLGLGLTLLVAFAGGLALAISAQRHVVQMSRATRNIIAGDLSQRLPVMGHDEHAELAKSVNSMLDQIEHLMGGLRHVGDSIAHDLRGPLTRLRTRLEALAAEPAPTRQSVEECLTQADGVLATFNALLRIARVESGAYRRAFANVDLGAIAADVAELYEATAEENLVEIRRRITDNSIVFGDRELLAQALTNLVDNALKYTPVGGHIDLEVKHSGDRIVVVVADSGPGIPAEARERVLQRFARLDESRSKPGNGLGLALVRAVCDQHDGTLVLSDNAPGLRVTMSLPVAR
jgi:signal transduction histidine kinase